MSSLGERSTSAVLWGAGGSFFRIVLQFATQIVLIRLLGPEHYGIFAIGVIVVGFSGFFADFGIAYGLIQKPDVSLDDLRFIFTFQALIGILVASSLAVLAYPIAMFFGEMRSVEVIRWLGMACLFNALAATSLNLLRRRLEYRRIQLAQIISYFIGYVVIGVGLAWHGLGVWSLVAAWVVQSAVAAALTFYFAPHPVRPLWRHIESRGITSYGFAVLGTNLCNWAINNLDRVIVGRYFPAREMGLYAQPYNMLFNPTTTLLGIVQPIFLSAASRMTDNMSRVVSRYLGFIELTALLMLPIFAAMAVAADTVVLAVFGAKWLASAPVFRALALVMPLFVFWGLTTPLLWLGGDRFREFKAQWPLLLFWIFVAWFAAQVSIVAVAWSTVGLFAMRFVVTARAATQLVPLRSLDLLRALRGGVFVAMGVSAAAGLLELAMAQLQLVPIARLFICLFVAIFGVIASGLICPRLVLPEAADLLVDITRPASPRFSAYLRARLVDRQRYSSKNL